MRGGSVSFLVRSTEGASGKCGGGSVSISSQVLLVSLASAIIARRSMSYNQPRFTTDSHFCLTRDTAGAHRQPVMETHDRQSVQANEWLFPIIVTVLGIIIYYFLHIVCSSTFNFR